MEAPGIPSVFLNRIAIARLQTFELAENGTSPFSAEDKERSHKFVASFLLALFQEILI